MTFEAIKALKERGGSSVQAIKKYITTNHSDVAFAPHQLRSALKKGVEGGKFIKVRIDREPKLCCYDSWPYYLYSIVFVS